MATNFDVTPEELESSANKIEGKAAEFTKAYNGIYTAVGDLNVSFQGQTNEEFNKKIESYKKDFTSAENALKSYIEEVRKYATSVKNTEIDLKGKASSLPSGN